MLSGMNAIPIELRGIFLAIIRGGWKCFSRNPDIRLPDLLRIKAARVVGRLCVRQRRLEKLWRFRREPV